MSFVADRFGFPPVVTQQQLAEMAPHVRSECVALMREAGLTVEQIARPLNVRPAVIERLASARHRYQLPRAAETVDEAGDAASKQAHRTEGLPRGSFLILKYAAQRQFEFSIGKDDLASELGVSHKIIDAGMTRLLDEGLIVRAAAGSGNKPALYRATERGEQFAAAVFHLDATGA